MATITSLGIGSGLDINTIVTQLVALERRPLEQMRTEASRLQTQVSSYGQLKSLFSTLQDASSALNNGPLWQRSVAKSSDESAVTAVGGADAVAGNYAVSVQSLARSQTLVSANPLGASNSLAGAGTLTLQLGSWAGAPAGFTAKPDSASLDITVTATDTLADVRDKINAAGAGVTATLVTDANGTRMSLRSSETGATNGFRIQVADADGLPGDDAGLSRLAYDPPGGTLGMESRQAATNAVATVNGVQIESASNEVSGIIDGLTLRLRKETGTDEVSVNLANDRAGVDAAIKSFVEAYNALAKFIGTQTRYDEASKTAGNLQGDGAVTAVQARLRAVLNMPSAAAAAFPRISDIGLQLQRDGTLKIDQAKLDSAMANLPELRTAFGNVDTVDPSNDGFTRRFANLARQLLDIDGSLSTRTEGLQKLITKNSDSQARLEDRVERFQQRLVAQYTAMDANLSRLNALGAYVNQQFSANKRNNGN
jgi:flagellar hook-associated protein 2